jgi:hypothetical protein
MSKVFKSEDDAFEAYLEECQAHFPYDITESNIDFADGFYDWLSDNEVEITE